MTDRIKSGEVVVDYCPTDQMVGDYFTKPLQGSLFRRMRSLLMNLDENDPHYYAGNEPKSAIVDDENTEHRSVLDDGQTKTYDARTVAPPEPSNPKRVSWADRVRSGVQRLL